ncbi:MAG: hypothetical protein ACP5O1_06640 [Phycisphaerae bacterium]
MATRNRLFLAALGLASACALTAQARLVILGNRIQPGGPMIPAGPPQKVAPTTHPAPKLSYPGLPPLNPARVKADIHALLSARYTVREKAANELLLMGDPVVPYLKKALNGLTTPEMRHLLRRDLQKIFKEDMMRGPLITLKLKNVSATTAIMDVCRQAGTTATFWNANSNATVSLDVKNAPFWRVIAMLSAKTGLAPSFGYNNGQPGIPFQQGQNTIGPYTSFSGAFAVSLQNATYQRNLDYTQPNGGRSVTFTVQMDLLMLPSDIGNVQMQPTMITQAVDSKGQALVTPNMSNFYGGQMMGAVANCSLNLNYPKHPSRRIKILKGYIPITGAVDLKALKVKISTKKSETLHIGGIHLKFGPESFVNNNWQLTYQITWPTSMSQQAQNIQNQAQNTGNMQGFGAGGVAASYINVMSSNGMPNKTIYTLQTNIKLAKLQLNIYRHPVNLKIPFKFTNVPMP